MSSQALCLHPTTRKLQLCDFKLPDTLPPGKVLIRMIAAPVTNLDLHVLEDTYPVKPKAHINDKAIPGYDGLAEVSSIASAKDTEETTLQVGDLVIPKAHGFGTWRTHAVVDPNTLVKLPPNTNPIAGAILKTSIAPAYFILKDVRDLHPGDWVV
jgi:trans-2-enoyl-CoA reductase